jgi:hypothetical protein
MGGKSRRFRKAGVLRALGSQAVQRTIVDRDCEGKRGVWEGAVHLLKIREQRRNLRRFWLHDRSNFAVFARLAAD